MWELRKADIHAADDLQFLWVNTFQQAYEDLHDKRNIDAYCQHHFSKAAAIEFLADNQSYCCIAYKEGKPVGFYLIRHHPSPIRFDADASELKQIYILTDEYGTGLGKVLFRHASEVIQNCGKHWVWLCVSDTNYRARSFYRMLGFQRLGRGPVIHVGSDRLISSVLIKKL